MLITAKASAPGRVCFAGEKLDWLLGPSVVAAIDLRIRVSISSVKLPNNTITFKAEYPLYIQRTMLIDEIGNYDGHLTDYMQASLKVLARLGCLLKPMVITVSSDIPVSAGLSSSAALCVATIAALGEYFELKLSHEELCNLAYSVENDELCTGAGQMDFYACCIGGINYLDSSNKPPHPIEKLLMPPGSQVLVVDTRSSKSTKRVTEFVRERIAGSDPLIETYIKKTVLAVENIRTLLACNTSELEHLGRIISNCHSYIKDYMQVSTDLINRCVDECLVNGAYGAKLTGAGMGGCLFAIVPSNKISKIEESLKKYPVTVYATRISETGVIVGS